MIPTVIAPHTPVAPLGETPKTARWLPLIPSPQATVYTQVLFPLGSRNYPP